MAITHAQSGEAVDVRPYGSSLSEHRTSTLAKSKDAEIIRLVLPAGKEIEQHSAPGQIILQCLEGQVVFTAKGQDTELSTGHLLYLESSEPHSLRAGADSSLLLTILLPQK